MTANRILDLIITILAWIVVPVQIVTTLVLGILVSCSFGLLLFPISFIWIVFIFPLIGASWLCNKFEVLRNPVGLIGIPWAVIAHTYCCLMPSMGELESRAYKLMLAEAWPFCWEYWQLGNGRLDISSPKWQILYTVVERISRNDAVKQRTVDRLLRREPLDPNV
ncbi:MAG: hypothetical protein WC476_02895 [Phycisphaerae bacterium]|jgi:hypothetical protein